MTIPDTLPFIVTSIHISSVSFRLFMSCPQNRKGKEKHHLEKLREKNSIGKGEEVGIAENACFSMRKISATEWPREGAAPNW